MPETVAICTLIEDRKAALIPRLAPRWAGIDLGGRERIYVVCTQDATEPTVAEFRRGVAPAEIRQVTLGNLEVLAPGAAQADTWGPDQLLRIAYMRQAVRQAALATAADWFFWIDSDVDPDAAGRPSFGCLHQCLTATVGPLRPRLASGVYATRFCGLPIQQWIDGNGNSYLPLLADRQTYSRVTGFGCLLMHREVLERVGWQDYPQHIADVKRHAEEAGQVEGVFGEDCWFSRLAEYAWGMPTLVDSRVLCRHYHADGSYWHYVPGEERSLQPRYVPAGATPGVTTRVRYHGEAALDWPILGRTIEPGEEVDLSPELLLTFETVIPGQYEEVAA